MRISTLITVLLCGTIASTTLAQSSAFSYQGQLKDGTTPANGVYDLRFKLFDAASAGTQVAPLVCIDNVQVTNGLFTVPINFGPDYSSPNSRYIEIDVRRDTGLNCSTTTGFVTQTPRQLLMATPLAIHARTASALDAPDGSPLNAVSVDNNGNVGVGTTTPTAPLHVMMPAAGSAGIRIQGLSSTAANTAFLSFTNSAGTDVGYVGDGSSGDDTVFLGAYRGDATLITPGGRVLTALADGSLRLGTDTGDYRHFTIGGGNSSGFLYGSFARLGDGIHMGYNYFADAAGNNQIVHPDGGTSRLSVGYGTIVLATAPPFGGAPVDRLVVDPNGNVLLGNSPQFYAAAGSENLRFVRGSVQANGAIVAGTGFTVSHPGTGIYGIIFTTPFTGIPTCTAISNGPIFVTTNTPGPTSASSVVIAPRSLPSGTSVDAEFSFIIAGPR